MISRRALLLGAGGSLVACGAYSSQALALSEEPMHPEDLSVLTLACQKPATHVQFLADARLALSEEIKLGLKPATATEMVVCPLCHCSFQVVPDVMF